MSTIGFGSIEKNVTERQKNNSYQYDFASTFNLGKFFPDDYGVKIPMYVEVQNLSKILSIILLTLIVLLKESLEILPKMMKKRFFKKYSPGLCSKKRINFTNVRKTKIQKKGEKNSKIDI